jgi:hypothetical protein
MKLTDLLTKSNRPDPRAELRSVVDQIASVVRARDDNRERKATLSASLASLLESDPTQWAEAKKALGEPDAIEERAALVLPKLEARRAELSARVHHDEIQTRKNEYVAQMKRVEAAARALAEANADAIALHGRTQAEFSGADMRHFTPIAYVGIAERSLLALWTDAMGRFWSPAPAMPTENKPKRSAIPRALDAPPVAAVTPALTVARHLPKPVKDGRVVTMLRANVELEDGYQSRIGDRLTVDPAMANRLVASGAADFD